MKFVSTQQMAEKIRSLKPADLNNWEKGFQATVERLVLADQLHTLTDPQIDVLYRLYSKHFD